MASDTKTAAKRAKAKADARDRADAPEKDAAPGGPLSIALDPGRWRHFVWLCVCGGIGAFLLVAMGLIGQILGALLAALALLHGWRFARTLLFPHRKIELADGACSLPSAVCGGRVEKVAIGDIKHAFFLRHAAPWAATGPVLVIETESAVHAYPRHWFSSDADQRRVATAIQYHLA